MEKINEKKSVQLNISCLWPIHGILTFTYEFIYCNTSHSVADKEGNIGKLRDIHISGNVYAGSWEGVIEVIVQYGQTGFGIIRDIS